MKVKTQIRAGLVFDLAALFPFSADQVATIAGDLAMDLGSSVLALVETLEPDSDMTIVNQGTSDTVMVNQITSGG